MIGSQIEAHRAQPLEWGAHYLLERQLSGPDAYRKMYERFVGEWADALAAASDSLPAGLRPEAARVCLSLIYGLMADAHIGACGAPDLTTISRQACGALNAYLEILRKG